ncbi:hypothetical protein GCM10011400_65740 [Paraburkholderia caffeinilytica]|uniref:Uncharacterized protein n=1 Tax=Paraburkholderia caffeinilytica TaxID=1761016 RepID=A0ABQ1NCC7_9BURK|nr:hypothetical protein GCM10011400_65740 [Paraburkholderia caffeinilytica]
MFERGDVRSDRVVPDERGASSCSGEALRFIERGVDDPSAGCTAVPEDDTNGSIGNNVFAIAGSMPAAEKSARANIKPPIFEVIGTALPDGYYRFNGIQIGRLGRQISSNRPLSPPISSSILRGTNDPKSLCDTT